MKIHNILCSSDVTRYHTAPLISAQSIAHHAWSVSILCQYLSPNCSKNLILAALTHDCAEAVSGDIPAPAKWKYSELKKISDEIEAEISAEWGINFNLTDDEKRTLKICDGLEVMLYLTKRYNFGEIDARIKFYKQADHMMQTFDLVGSEKQLFEEIVDAMEGSAYAS